MQIYFFLLFYYAKYKKSIKKNNCYSYETGPRSAEETFNSTYKISVSYNINGFQTPFDDVCTTIEPYKPEEFKYTSIPTSDGYTLTWDNDENVEKYEIALLPHTSEDHPDMKILSTVVPGEETQCSTYISKASISDINLCTRVIIHYKNGLELRLPVNLS